MVKLIFTLMMNILLFNHVLVVINIAELSYNLSKTDDNEKNYNIYSNYEEAFRLLYQNGHKNVPV